MESAWGAGSRGRDGVMAAEGDDLEETQMKDVEDDGRGRLD